MTVQKKVTGWLNTLSPSLSNKIIRVLTQQFSISRWDNRLLGLGKFPIQTIIDIGANEGQSCRKLKSIFPNSTLYAFEPSPIAYKQLKNLSYENFYPLNLAIGKENDKVTFFEHSYFTESSSLLKTTQECEESYPFLKNQNEILIEQNTLDYFFERKELTGDILIKIDVQGAEDRVIAGGKKVLSQAVACIVECTITSAYEQQASFEMISGQLNNLDYKFVGVIDQASSPNGSVQYFDAVFVKKKVLRNYQ